MCLYRTDHNINILVALPYWTIGLGVLLILTALCGVAVIRRSKWLKLIYIFLLLVEAAALSFIAYTAYKLSTGKLPFNLESDLLSAWEATVSKEPGDACSIQRVHNCYGFYDGVCTGCWAVSDAGVAECAEQKRGLCPQCVEGAVQVTVGCFTSLMRQAKQFYRPVGYAAMGVAGLLLLDVVAISFL